MSDDASRPIQILLVEDNPDDVELTREALRDARIRNEMHVAADGEQALEFLRGDKAHADRVLPDLVLLDLNLPRFSGQQVLLEIKQDAALRQVPVVVLTTSASEDDVAQAYDLHANCYITKPVDFDQFVRVVRTVKDFWFDIVRLPSGGEAGPASSRSGRCADPG